MRLIFLLPFLCSCSIASGFVYTDVVRPECVDMRNTSLGTKRGVGSTRRVKVPTTRMDLTAEWSSRAIGEIAKASHISTVNFCDRRTVSVLGGIYESQQVIIYGD